MRLTINGGDQDHPDGISIADLLDRLGMNPSLVAVEVNRQLVTRRRHSLAQLRDGDAVEIVTLVGGG